MREQILEIIQKEFSKLIRNIQEDFQKNYKAKRNNFLLNELDSLMTVHMVFVSSFESKSGNSLQRVARNIAKLRYGPENVPQIINPHNLPHNLSVTEEQEQIVVSNINIESPQTKAYLTSFINQKLASGRGRYRQESQVTHQTIPEILHHTTSDGRLHSKPVDLAFLDENGIWNIMEIKAGGDLDNSNAPANAEKLLLIYMALNIESAKPYFATYYNKEGEGNVWKGVMKKFINYPSMFLIGENFWNKILPIGLDFTEFCQIYNEAMRGINLNHTLNTMIQTCQEN